MTAARKLQAAPRATAAVRRVAVYTRKSTDKGLDAAFTSLDNQREAILSYVAAQAGLGWVPLQQTFEDGGFSGGTTDRPAFQRLLEAVRAGEVDVIVVYKIDRFSRSLADFIAIMAELNERGVALASVSEAFDTGTAMGRMTVSLLATFAQFEREMISERTRDKLAASRRKGMWVGGTAPFGYTVEHKSLVAHPEDADRLREIFRLYLRLGSVRQVCDEINGRGWRTNRGGRWSLATVASLLKQPAYIGKVRYRDEVHEGQHEGLIEPEAFARVQELLATQRQRGGSQAKNRHQVLLRGVLLCGGCGRPMRHTYSGKGPKRYHYYACTCAHARVRVHEVEGFVIEQLAALGRDPELIHATVGAAKAEADRQRPALAAEAKQLRREKAEVTGKAQRLLDALAAAPGATASITAEIARHEETAATLDARLAEIEAQLTALNRHGHEAEEVAAALRDFDTVWRALHPRERERLMRLIVEAVAFHGTSGEVEITWREGFGGGR